MRMEAHWFSIPGNAAGKTDEKTVQVLRTMTPNSLIRDAFFYLTRPMGTT